MNDDSLASGAQRVAGKERGSGLGSLGKDHVGLVGCDDLRTGNRVDEAALSIREDDLITNREGVQVSKWLTVARAMPADNHIARLTRQRCAGPVPRAAVQSGEADPLVHRLIEGDLGDLDQAKIDDRFAAAHIGRRRDGHGWNEECRWRCYRRRGFGCGCWRGGGRGVLLHRGLVRDRGGSCRSSHVWGRRGNRKRSGGCHARDRRNLSGQRLGPRVGHSARASQGACEQGNDAQSRPGAHPLSLAAG